MAFAVTYNFDGQSTFDPAQVDQNFADVETALNGGLTTANLSTSAGITNSQLANSIYEIVIPITIHGTDLDASPLTVPIAVASIPDATGSDGSYTCIGYSWVATENGGAGTTTTFKVEWGSFTGASNAWTAHATILAATSIPTVSGTRPESSGGAVSVALSGSGSASTPRFIGLIFTAADASFLGTFSKDYIFNFTLKVKRTNGLRA
jgi:hypothetical protein